MPFPPEERPISLGEHGKTVDAAMVSLGRMAAAHRQAATMFARSRLLDRKEALSSSGMEGTQSTLDAILSLESSEELDQDGSMRTSGDGLTRQVRRYAQVLSKLVPQARRVGPGIFTIDLMLKIHSALMADEADYIARHKSQLGEFRGSVVWIGGHGTDIAYSTWNPPGPEYLSECLSNTIAYMQADGPHVLFQPILLRVAIAHADFEAVHPFADGNGRVGRLLIPMMLAAKGHEPVYLSPWIEANRAQYYEGLKAAQQQLNPVPLVAALANAVIATEAEVQRTDEALGELSCRWRAAARLRRSSSADRLIDLLPWLPVVSIKTVCDQLDVTPKAAGDGVARLVDLGILHETTGYRRNRVFSCPDALRVLSRPFGADPILPGDDMDPESDQADDTPGWR